MIEGIPRISVYIITYNQEDVIDRTLGSILSQRDYVYEICVSDDHSTDRTWDILQDYDKRYPGLFKLNRNDPNLGIFENTEKVWTMPTGDIVYDLAGDDCVGEGWFKNVVEHIQNNRINYKNELFCIYGDYKCIYPNGDSMVFRQNAVAKCPNDALRLALRGIITGRGCCYSVNVLHQFDKVSAGRSHKAELAQDRQLQLCSKNNYYISRIGNIYYSSIGISTQIQNEELYKDRLDIWPYMIQYFDQKNIHLKKADINYGKFNIAIKKFRHCKTLASFLNVIYSFIISRDMSLPNGNGFRHFIFAIRRRIPHKKAICM